MTTEWPDAPRLRDALERAAAEARTDTAVREHLRGLLEDADGEDVVLVPSSAPERARSRRGFRLATAAAIVVAVATGAFVLSVDRDGGPDEVRSSATPPAPATVAPSPVEVPTATARPAPIPPPLLATRDHCGRSLGDPEPFLLEAGDVAIEVGVAGGGIMQPTLVVIGSDTWQAAASELPAHASAGLTSETVYYLPGSLESEAAVDVKRELLFSTCGSSSYLLASSAGYTAATVLACAQLPNEGFGGYAFIAPGSPPDECDLAHPVIILSSEPLVDRLEWELHQGCSDATTTADDEGNLITTYGSCDNTLIHVETPAPDPLQATINGIPSAEFLAQLTGIAR